MNTNFDEKNIVVILQYIAFKIHHGRNYINYYTLVVLLNSILIKINRFIV